MMLFQKIICILTFVCACFCICSASEADTTVATQIVSDSSNVKRDTTLQDTLKSAAVINKSDQNLIKLDKVHVDVASEKEFRSNQTVSVIKPEDWAGTKKNLADIIADEPGIQTRKFGGEGSFQTVSIHGVDGKEILVLLDGIILNSAMGGAVDLGLIDPETIDEISIYKGFVPAVFGGNALGGVIDITSKKNLKSNAAGISLNRGAYGYQKSTVQVNRFLNSKVKIFSALSYKSGKNDWTYLDRNKTPRNTDDDSLATVKNHEHKNIALALTPSLLLSDDRVLSLSIGYTSSQTGIPAAEGSVNRTAKADNTMFHASLGLNKINAGEENRITLTPSAGYIYDDNKTFWTSLDESMGTKHGALSTIPNSYCRLSSYSHSLNLSLLTNVYLLTGLSTAIAVGTKYAMIQTGSESSHFLPSNDWPGNSEELSVATDINYDTKWGVFLPGANVTIGGKILRNQTDGGNNTVISKIVEKTDTIQYPWSIWGGLHCGISDRIKLLINAGRFSSVPSLRERYGFNGAVSPNPDLLDENGTSFEAVVRYRTAMASLNGTLFYSKIENGIIIVSDGAMSRPVNMGKTLTKGIEVAASLTPLHDLHLGLIGVYQQARNITEYFNAKGRILPNEPDVDMSFDVEYKLFKIVSLRYLINFKSELFRDEGNSLRVPDDITKAGTLNHNVKVEGTFAKKITAGVSVNNLTMSSFRYESILSGVDESGYSWIVFPQNEWNFFIKANF